MSSIVRVVFDRNREYELIAHDGTLSRDEANLWLDAQWESLECEPTHPMGKVLVLDRILGVAQFAGEKHFNPPGDWAQRYAEAVVAILQRPVIRIDIADRVVG